MIEFKNVKKSYNDQVILQNMSFQIKDGGVYALVGKNGCGKTTSIKMMLGLIPPDAGEILIDGHKTSTIKKYNDKKITYVSDKFEENVKCSLFDYLSFYAECYGIYGSDRDNKIEKVLNQLFLEDKKSEIVDSFSKGTKSIISVAKILIADSDIVIIDELFDGLDSFSREEMKSFLITKKKPNATIVLATHQLNEIKDLCTHVILIGNHTVKSYGETCKVLSGKEFQKKLIIEIDDRKDEALHFFRLNTQVTDVTLRYNKFYITFSGTKDDEIQLLKSLVENNFYARSFTYNYEYYYNY